MYVGKYCQDEKGVRLRILHVLAANHILTTQMRQKVVQVQVC